MRIRLTNSPAQTPKATISFNSTSTCSSGSMVPAQPENRLSSVDMARDTSSRKPNARM